MALRCSEQLKNTITSSKLKNDNQGFSLVEVLIAVFVLAIVFTPVMKSFMVASITNSKAQEIQNATSLAETVMEEVKSKSIRELSEVSNTPHFADSVSEIEFTAKKQEIQADGTKGIEEPVTNPAKDLFDDKNVNILPPYTIKYKNVTATQGRKYDVEVTITPDGYSEPISTPPVGSSSSTEIQVNAANNIELPQFNEIDTSQNAVLSWEINKHDGVAFEALLDKNVEDTTGGDGVVKSWWHTINRIRRPKASGGGDGGIKTVKIVIEDVGSDRAVKCDVSYDPNIDDTYKDITYSVYYSEFKKDKMQDIYVFYTLMKDDFEALNRQENAGSYNYDFSLHTERFVIEDNSTYASDENKPNIYFILQKYTANSSSTVTINYASNNIKIISPSGGYPSPEATLYIESVSKDSNGNLTISNLNHNFLTNFIYFENSAEDYGWKHGDLFETSKKDKVYTVNVDVKKSGSNDVLANVSSTINAGNEASEKD